MNLSVKGTETQWFKKLDKGELEVSFCSKAMQAENGSKLRSPMCVSQIPEDMKCKTEKKASDNKNKVLA